MLLRSIGLLVAASVLAACGGSSKEAATTTSGLPPGCEVEQTEAVVDDFLAAVSRGDRVAAQKLLADDLRLFEVHDGRGRGERHFLARTKAKAMRYVDERIRHHERLRLVNLQVQPADDNNHVLVTFTLTRLADDFRRRGIPNRVAQGDGVVDCVEGNLEGWSVQGP